MKILKGGGRKEGRDDGGEGEEKEREKERRFRERRRLVMKEELKR